eukprot:CAMPEP_0117447338 /NCGR_PEP_ID=MMETSP0759-20121206/6823_1 /TAXON_ID=63605 /ORGANISM="Percolomonas cosmopolitus, Strain WS" /LENGTH=142 /DNA_ID=CAMNT_0005239669 /DNA_START=44 /DNA_END=472 /DNA_ORIENTATION=+
MVRRGAIRNNPTKGRKQIRKVTYKYFIDCAIPAEDGIFDLDHFEKYIADNYKVVKGAHKGDLGKKVRLFKKSENLHVHTDVKVSRRYLKYLTKKYLHRQELGEWLRVVSAPGRQKGYTLKYFNIGQEEQPAAAEETAEETTA